MIEDWRRALDKNLVVGIVFIFCKAFDSVSHHVLLNRLQAIVIAGDLWRWIKDYLELLSWPLSSYSRKWFSVRTFTCEVWRAKGSVLGPTLFSLFCNDVPDIVEDCDCEIHMYVTTLRFTWLPLLLRRYVHTCTCRKDHLWPGLVHTQRSDLSPKQMAQC